MISLVIRTRNDRKNLEKIFSILENQDYHGKLEIILVDTESNDGTVEYALGKNCQVINIKQKEFSYPKALNLGFNKARGEIIISLVGHAFPVGNKWLSCLLVEFADESVVGVYSPVLPSDKASMSEYIFYIFGFYFSKFFADKYEKKARLGIMGNTNSAYRKSIFEKHNFSENYGMGGEDYEWASWALKNGYKIKMNFAFAVRHSHGLGLINLIKQISIWRKTTKPGAFSEKDLDYRKFDNI